MGLRMAKAGLCVSRLFGEDLTVQLFRFRQFACLMVFQRILEDGLCGRKESRIVWLRGRLGWACSGLAENQFPVALEIGESLIESSHLFQRHGQMLVSLGIIWRQPNSL